MAITLAELRTRARQRADMEESEFVSDSELNGYINNSIAELHDILIQAYNTDYYIESYQFTTINNQDAYDLPADFYKLRGVDAQLNGNSQYTLKPFNFNERNRFNNFGVWNLLGISNIRYRLVGDQLKFSPVPDRATQITMWYIPVATELVADTDELQDLNGYHEYVIIDAAIKMLQKEESDIAVLALQKAAIIERLNSAAQNRDAGSSESVSDIYADNDDFTYWRS